MGRVIKIAAICLISFGVITLIGPTFGFSTVALDRGLSVNTADDPNALLGIDNEDDTTDIQLRADSDPLTVATLENNANQQLEVQDIVVQSVGDDDVNDDVVSTDSPIPGSVIEENDEVEVTIECADDESYGEEEVEVRVIGVEGQTMAVENPTFSTTVDIQCGQGKFTGSVNFSATDIGEDENTHTVSFNVDGLGNNDEAKIDFINPQEGGGVDYSEVMNEDLTITSEEHGGELSFDSDRSRLTYSPQGNEDGEITIERSNVDVVGNEEERYYVEYSDTLDNDDGDFFEIQ